MYFLLTDSIGIVYRDACLPFIRRFHQLQHVRLSTRYELKLSEIVRRDRSTRRLSSLKTLLVELHSSGSFLMDTILTCDTLSITTVYRQQDLPEDVTVDPLVVQSAFGHCLKKVGTNDINVLTHILKLNIPFDLYFWWDEDTTEEQYMRLEASGKLASDITLPLYDRATSRVTRDSTIMLQTSTIESWQESLQALSQLDNVQCIDCDSLGCPLGFHRHRIYSVIVPATEYEQVSMYDMPEGYVVDATPLFDTDWEQWRANTSSICCRVWYGSAHRIRKPTVKSQGVAIGTEAINKSQKMYARYLKSKLDCEF